MIQNVFYRDKYILANDDYLMREVAPLSYRKYVQLLNYNMLNYSTIAFCACNTFKRLCSILLEDWANTV